MKLILRRKYLGAKYTIGALYIDGVYLCDTLEDQVRDINHDGDLNDEGEGKVFGETSIPYGIYAVDLTMSPKFKRLLPLIKDVPHFTGIRIHRGNAAKDTHGCILLGENKEKGKVLFSTKYEMLVIEKMMEGIKRGETIAIEIV